MRTGMGTAWRRRMAIFMIASFALVPFTAHADDPTGGGGGNASCDPAPDVVCKVDPGVAPVGMNVVASADMFEPATIDVKAGQVLYFQNLDGDDHTVTLTGCNKDPNCDKALPVGAAGPFAAKFPISLRDFQIGKTYTYKCSIHIGMTGSFTVH